MAIQQEVTWPTLLSVLSRLVLVQSAHAVVTHPVAHMFNAPLEVLILNIYHGPLGCPILPLFSPLSRTGKSSPSQTDQGLTWFEFFTRLTKNLDAR